MRLEPTFQSVANVHEMSSAVFTLPLWPFATLRPVPTPRTLRSPLEVDQVRSQSWEKSLQGFDKVVPPFEALLKFHGGEGFEEVVPLSKTHRNSACLKG